MTLKPNFEAPTPLLIHATKNQDNTLLKMSLALTLCLSVASAMGIIISGLQISLLIVCLASTVASGILLRILIGWNRAESKIGRAIFEQHEACVLGERSLVGRIIFDQQRQNLHASNTPKCSVQLFCIYEELSSEISDTDHKFGGPILWQSEQIELSKESPLLKLTPPKHLPPSLTSSDRKTKNRWILTSKIDELNFQFELHVDTRIEANRYLQCPR